MLIGAVGDLIARVSNPGLTDEQASILIYETCDRAVEEITKLALETRKREKMQYELNRQREQAAETERIRTQPDREREAEVGQERQRTLAQYENAKEYLPRPR